MWTVHVSCQGRLSYFPVKKTFSMALNHRAKNYEKSCLRLGWMGFSVLMACAEHYALVSGVDADRVQDRTIGCGIRKKP